MERVLTDDGSFTYHNESVDEHYHSLAGAAKEARIKYVEPLGLDGKEAPVLLDICFGLGYNSAVALEHMRRGTIICFENDREILKAILDLKPDLPRFTTIQEFVSSALKGDYEYTKDNVRLVMMLGDARQRIREVKLLADGVCFDPFSPRKAPEMWTEEFFRDIVSRMKPGACLATYSCAGWIRKNMASAGLIVGDGPVFGRKSPGTVAIKNADST